MNTLEAIESRRAIHNYIKGKKIPKEVFEKLVYYTSFTPSGYNAQPWEFLIIEDQKKKDDLKQIAFGQEHVPDASAIVIVLGDTLIGRNAENILKDWVKYGYCTEEKVPAYRNAFTKKRSKQRLREMCIRNVSLAVMTFMLAAEDMGLATCPMMGFNQPMLCEYLELPEDIIPIMMIAIGYEEEGKEKKQLPRKKVEDLMYFEKYGRN